MTASLFDSPVDEDPQETQEWRDAWYGVLARSGPERARFLLEHLDAEAHYFRCGSQRPVQTPYWNTIPVHEEPAYPGDLALEARLEAYLRWNAMAMVVRADDPGGHLGGHIGPYASSSTLYEVGFNHFWRAPSAEHPGDLIYFQGHITPGVYARSFLSGDLNERHLNAFRREATTPQCSLSSYPHPWLMPHYWQFPTVSMGLGPLQAIYQARFLKYMEARGLLPEGPASKVWCFCGDGEMDEPESTGALSIAAREGLDNLIFVINCNLQRLDGPVRGNGKIIQELEGLFLGADWSVLKVIWGSGWDDLLARDHSRDLLRTMERSVDGEYQNCKAKGGAYTRQHFFGQSEHTQRLVADWSDEQISNLLRGGHDAHKVHAAYQRAVTTQGKPVVILAKTVKGYGLGSVGEAQNTAHNLKKLDISDLKAFRDRFDLPIKDEALAEVPYYKPPDEAPEMRYLKERREALGGALPQRRQTTTHVVPVPELSVFDTIMTPSGERSFSTTMAFVRLLGILLKQPEWGPRIVPIVPDEARTFGMEGLFRQIGIYMPGGQKYRPVDADQVMFYKEIHNGQILQEGINEAGAFASWIAAGTSYSTCNSPTIPFYIYYSMFGFQRIGDLAWAAGDSRTRGFLIGATAGRTTLSGEGLQHNDGQSHTHASLIPNCKAYDPCYAHELAVVIQHGLQEMVAEQKDVFYYISVTNESHTHPGGDASMASAVVQGLYLLEEVAPEGGTHHHVRLIGSGPILREAQKAARLLATHCGVHSHVFSATSFIELAREALGVSRTAMHAGDPLPTPYVARCLAQGQGPVVAASDYVRAHAEQIRPWVCDAPYYVLGTDGFGRSDGRAALRQHFEVNAAAIAYQAMYALWATGACTREHLSDAQQHFSFHPETRHPWDA